MDGEGEREKERVPRTHLGIRGRPSELPILRR